MIDQISEASMNMIQEEAKAVFGENFGNGVTWETSLYLAVKHALEHALEEGIVINGR